MNPRLLTGDPITANASFTQFVLPFAYQLQRMPYPPLSGPRYEDCSKGDWLCPAMPWGTSLDCFETERLRYLTPETSRVLFQRGRWLTLRRLSEASWEKKPEQFNDEEMRIKIPRKDGPSFDLILRNPGLILMEWTRELDRMHQYEDERTSASRDLCACQQGEGKRAVDADQPIFNTACGFLVLECFFPAQQEQSVELQDLLKVNELIRYWQQPYERHWKDKAEPVLSHLPLLKSKQGHEVPPGSPLYYQELWARWLEYPIHVPCRCRENDVRLIPQSWMDESRKPAHLCDREAKTAPTWAVQPDNRAHVWTCGVHWDGEPPTLGKDVDGKQELIYQGNPALDDRVRKIGRGDETAPEGSTPWLRLLNVDSPYDPMNDKVSPFEAQWLPAHTYTRWAHYGTLYGFTPHSGAMLTAPCKEPPAWQHFRIMYFDQAIMMLYVRTCLFRFSQRLSALTAKATKLPPTQPVSSEVVQDFRALRWEFAQFTSLYQFPLISNQQQAVEMYTALRKHMDIQHYYEHVRQEIQTIQDFLATEEAAKQTEKTMLLTVVATAGLVLSLVLSLMGVDAFMGWFEEPHGGLSFIILLGIGIAGLLLFGAPFLLYLKCPIIHNKVNKLFFNDR